MFCRLMRQSLLDLVLEVIEDTGGSPLATSQADAAS
jgi:hypothetical protein